MGVAALLCGSTFWGSWLKPGLVERIPASWALVHLFHSIIGFWRLCDAHPRTQCIQIKTIDPVVCTARLHRIPKSHNQRFGACSSEPNLRDASARLTATNNCFRALSLVRGAAALRILGVSGRLCKCAASPVAVAASASGNACLPIGWWYTT